MNFQFNPRQLENHFQLMDLQETKEPDGVVGVKNTGKVIAEDPDVRLHRFIVIGASNSGKTIFGAYSFFTKT